MVGGLQNINRRNYNSFSQSDATEKNWWINNESILHLSLVQIRSPQGVVLTQFCPHYRHFHSKSDTENSCCLYLRLCGNSVFQNGDFLRRNSSKMLSFLNGNGSHVLNIDKLAQSCFWIPSCLAHCFPWRAGPLS